MSEAYRCKADSGFLSKHAVHGTFSESFVPSRLCTGQEVNRPGWQMVRRPPQEGEWPWPVCPSPPGDTTQPYVPVHPWLHLSNAVPVLCLSLLRHGWHCANTELFCLSPGQPVQSLTTFWWWKFPWYPTQSSPGTTWGCFLVSWCSCNMLWKEKQICTFRSQDRAWLFLSALLVPLLP